MEKGVKKGGHILDPFLDPFLAERDAFQGAIWQIEGFQKGSKKWSNVKSGQKTTFLRFEISEKVLEPHGFSGFSTIFGPPFCGSAKPASGLPHFHMSF
jgi:hypothetical protein